MEEVTAVQPLSYGERLGFTSPSAVTERGFVSFRLRQQHAAQIRVSPWRGGESGMGAGHIGMPEGIAASLMDWDCMQAFVQAIDWHFNCIGHFLTD